MPLERSIERADDERATSVLVESDALHVPVSVGTARQLANDLSVGRAPELEVTVPVPLRREEEGLLLLQETHRRERDPRRARLGEHRGRGAGHGVDAQEREPLLIA